MIFLYTIFILNTENNISYRSDYEFKTLKECETALVKLDYKSLQKQLSTKIRGGYCQKFLKVVK